MRPLAHRPGRISISGWPELWLGNAIFRPSTGSIPRSRFRAGSSGFPPTQNADKPSPVPQLRTQRCNSAGEQMHEKRDSTRPPSTLLACTLLRAGISSRDYECKRTFQPGTAWCFSLPTANGLQRRNACCRKGACRSRPSGTLLAHVFCSLKMPGNTSGRRRMKHA